MVNGNSRKGNKGNKKYSMKFWTGVAKLEISKNKIEGIALKTEKIRKFLLCRMGGDRLDKKRKRVKERKADLASRLPVIKIGDKSIGFKNLVKYLGVWFDLKEWV